MLPSIGTASRAVARRVGEPSGRLRADDFSPGGLAWSGARHISSQAELASTERHLQAGLQTELALEIGDMDGGGLRADEKHRSDLGVALALANKREAWIMADAPLVPLENPEFVILRSKRVAGFTFHPVWRFDLANVVVQP